MQLTSSSVFASSASRFCRCSSASLYKCPDAATPASLALFDVPVLAIFLFSSLSASAMAASRRCFNSTAWLYLQRRPPHQQGKPMGAPARGAASMASVQSIRDVLVANQYSGLTRDCRIPQHLVGKLLLLPLKPLDPLALGLSVQMVGNVALTTARVLVRDLDRVWVQLWPVLQLGLLALLQL